MFALLNVNLVKALLMFSCNFSCVFQTFNKKIRPDVETMQ